MKAFAQSSRRDGSAALAEQRTGSGIGRGSWSAVARDRAPQSARGLAHSKTWRSCVARGIAVLSLLQVISPVPNYAFPPAPDHIIYGTVRDEQGNPLSSGSGKVILETASGVKIPASIAASNNGVNYQVVVPMDSGITSDLYKPTALLPFVAFKLKVLVGSTTFLPIEMVADYSHLGEPGRRTRINLTLGVDSDGDGLPDAWERALIQHLGENKTLRDINPNDDSDGDGISNSNEYLAGTYAFDSKDGFSLKAVGQVDGDSLLEFMALRGRTYKVVASDDFKNWHEVSFQVLTSGIAGPELSSYPSGNVSLLRVKVAAQPEGVSGRFFKLIVE
jgi:hypothetical protein